MIAMQLQDRDLTAVHSARDETRNLRFNFPISSADGAASTSVVYFELEPGEHTGMHTDSAEETVLILSGRVEAVVGDETVRVVGLFTSNVVVSVFEDAMMPAGRHVVGSPQPQELDVVATPYG